MDQPGFDPSTSVKFDLNRGVVSLDGRDTRVLVPSSLLLKLCQNAGPSARREFGEQLGRDAANRVAQRVGATPALTNEALLEQLGGDLALLGLGSLGMERWGHALVLTVAGSPLGPEGEDVLGAVLAGAIGQLFGREAELVALTRDADLLRFVVLSRAAASGVKQWIVSGIQWGEIVTRLHQSVGRKSE